MNNNVVVLLLFMTTTAAVAQSIQQPTRCITIVNDEEAKICWKNSGEMWMERENMICFLLSNWKIFQSDGSQGNKEAIRILNKPQLQHLIADCNQTNSVLPSMRHLLGDDNDEDGQGAKVVGIVLGCIGGCLLLSLAISIYYCKHYHLCCFNRKIGSSSNSYVFSISKMLSQQRSEVSQPTGIGAITVQNQQNEYSTLELTTRDAEFRPMSNYVENIANRYSRNTLSLPAIESIDSDDENQEFHEVVTVENFNFENDSQNGQKARSVYKFDPSTCQDSSGLISLDLNEEVIILQSDLGSGWTYVLNTNRQQTGFVPTSSIQAI